MEQIIAELNIAQIISTIVYGLIGIIMFIIGFIIIEKLTPYSVHKEISEDHNTALGVIIGAVMIAIAIIVAAAIK